MEGALAMYTHMFTLAWLWNSSSDLPVHPHSASRPKQEWASGLSESGDGGDDALSNPVLVQKEGYKGRERAGGGKARPEQQPQPPVTLRNSSSLKKSFVWCCISFPDLWPPHWRRRQQGAHADIQQCVPSSRLCIPSVKSPGLAH